MSSTQIPQITRSNIPTHHNIFTLRAVASDKNSKEWFYDMLYGDRTCSGTIRNPYADDENAEEELRWLLEEHAIINPFRLGRAAQVNDSIIEYGQALNQSIQDTMDKLCPMESREDDPFLTTLYIEGKGDDISIQSLHWEAIELLPDNSITIVRSIRPGVSDHGGENGSDVPPVEGAATNDTGRGSSQQLAIDSQEDTFATHSCLNMPVLTPPKLQVLFCTARSSEIDDSDVSYRILSRVVHNTLSQSANIQMDFVRPATWESLQEALGRKQYHIVHFDVHGKITRRGAFIELVRKDDPSRMKRRSAIELGNLLSAHEIPLVIFNACESAKSTRRIDGNIAATLIQMGVKAVIGMSFKLLVSSASIIMPLLYEQLLKCHGNMVHAIQHVRRALSMDKDRQGILDSKVTLPDAIVPVLYQSSDQNIFQSLCPELFPSLGSTRLQRAPTFTSTLDEDDEGVIGRDLDILRFETALTSECHVIELTGAIGCGKTTFLQHAAQWWLATDLVDKVLYLDDDDRTSLSINTPDSLFEFLSTEILETDQFETDLTHENSQTASPKGLLVLDNMSDILASLTEARKGKWREAFQSQQSWYIILASDLRKGAYLGGFKCLSLLKLSPAIAMEIAVSFSPRNSTWRGLFTAEDEMFLERCVWALDFNPLAIRLYITNAKSRALENYGEIYYDIIARVPHNQLLQDVSRTRIMELTRSLFDLAPLTEKVGLLATGLFFLRMRKDLGLLAELTVYAIKDWSETTDRTTCLLQDGIPRTWQEYEETFASAVRRLESKGLVLHLNEDYYEVHPLLGWCIAIIADDYEAEFVEILTNSHLELYRKITENWPVMDIPKFWASDAKEPTQPKSVGYMLSEDYANCFHILHCCILQIEYSEWAHRFPWSLLINLNLQITGESVLHLGPSARAVRQEIEALNSTMMIHWERYARAETMSSRFKEQTVHNGGAHMGFLAMAFSAMILEKSIAPAMAIGGSHISMDAYRFYSEFIELFPEVTANLDPLAIQLLAAKVYLGGYQMVWRDMNLASSQYDLLESILPNGGDISTQLLEAYKMGFNKAVEDFVRKKPESRHRSSMLLPSFQKFHLIEAKAEVPPNPRLPPNTVFDIVPTTNDALSVDDATNFTLGTSSPRGGTQGEIFRESSLNSLLKFQHLGEFATRPIWEKPVNDPEVLRIYQTSGLGTRMLELDPDVQDPTELRSLSRVAWWASVRLEAILLIRNQKQEMAYKLLLDARKLFIPHWACPLHRSVIAEIYWVLELSQSFRGDRSTRTAVPSFWDWYDPQPHEPRISSLLFESACLKYEDDILPEINIPLGEHKIEMAQFIDSVTSCRVFFRGLLNGIDDTILSNSRFFRTSELAMSGAREEVERNMGIERTEYTKLLRRVIEELKVDLMLGSTGSELAGDAIMVEAERILFGNQKQCTGLKYFKEYEGKPLRKFLPWDKPDQSRTMTSE
ncbi:hypothetical protein TWF281_005138 [Arthrobotrys megalospora]